ncbi:MAG: AsnC family transcriptional regulator [Halobaculum sp.]
MRELDETDMVILRLLAEDGRRAYSEIGDVVDLTPPAVSDRVSRLQDAGVIEQFTIDVDRSTLRGGTPVLVRVDPTQGALDDVRSALAAAEATEHLFTTADGSVVAFARTTTEAVHEWVTDTVGSEKVADVEVDLVADTEWTPTVDATGFALDCAECGNTVTSEGTTAEVGGEQRHFCCASCESAYVERYRDLEEAADAE